MKNSILALIIYLILFPGIACAQLTATYSINSTTIQKIENFIDENTLVLISLDGTLVMPKSLMFSYNSLYKNFMQEMLVRSRKLPVYKTVIANWYLQRQLILVEENWPIFIERLKAKGAKVYGISALPFEINGIEQTILNQLKLLGITFTEKVNQDNMLKIAEQGQWISLFYEGILFSGPFSKSKCLLDFIKISNISPKKIVVFDNTKSTLKAFDDSLKLFSMHFYNIEYLAAKALKGVPDPEIVKFQQKTLLETGVWLEDEKAKTLLKKK